LSGNKAYSLKPESNMGQILTVRDRRDETDIDLLRQEIVAPLAMLEELYPAAAREHAPELTIYFLSDQPEKASNYFLNQIESVPANYVVPYEEFYSLEYYFIDDSSGSPYVIAFLAIIAIFVMLLALFSLEVIETTHEIGVRKILGQSAGHISSRLLYRLALSMLAVFIGASVITLLTIIKNWNRLTLSFLQLPALLLLGFIFMLVIALAISHFYVKRIDPVISSKRQNSLQFFSDFGLVMKILLILLLASQLFVLVPDLILYFGESRAEQLYGEYLLSVHPDDDTFPLGTERARKSTCFAINQVMESKEDELEQIHTATFQAGGVLMHGSPSGEVIEHKIKQPHAVTTFQVTLANDIIGLDGAPIRIEGIPKQTTVLVSEGADLNEIMEIGWFLNWEDNSIHVPIRPGQKVLMSNGEYLRNPVIIIYSEFDNPFGTGWILDTTENRAILSTALDESGLDRDTWVFQSSPLIQLKHFYRSTLLLYLWTALFLLAAFIVISLHNAEVYATDRSKLLHLRYLHGVPFLRRYSGLWLRAAIPYAVAAILAFSFPSLIHRIMKLSYQGVYHDAQKLDLTFRLVFLMFGALLLFDLLLHAGVIRRLQKKSVTRLKGER
ncbi:MAG: ABC transporter permease, partial [Eubacteriales bacterium]|nr:ABC transporter permease [Eubacteriales bacterium]